MNINEINDGILLNLTGADLETLPAYTKCVILSRSVSSWACEMTEHVLVGQIFEAFHAMGYDLEEMSKDKTVLDFLRLITGSSEDFNLNEWVTTEIRVRLQDYEDFEMNDAS